MTDSTGSANTPCDMASALRASGSTYAWRAIRLHVLNTRPHMCTTCGRELTPAEIDVGHVTPRIQGGSDDDLIVQCQPCNRAEGARIRNRRRKGSPVKTAPLGELF